jgi:hypothetical protein
MSEWTNTLCEWHLNMIKAHAEYYEIEDNVFLDGLKMLEDFIFMCFTYRNFFIFNK